MEFAQLDRPGMRRSKEIKRAERSDSVSPEQWLTTRVLDHSRRIYIFSFPRRFDSFRRSVRRVQIDLFKRSRAPL